MVVFSIRHHIVRAHGIVMPHTQEVEVGGGVPDKYVVSFP